MVCGTPKNYSPLHLTISLLVQASKGGLRLPSWGLVAHCYLASIRQALWVGANAALLSGAPLGMHRGRSQHFT